MSNNDDFASELLEDARVRIPYLGNATSEEIYEWQLKRVFQLLSQEKVKETCPKDVYGWIPKNESSQCKRCSISHQMSAIIRMQCWQEWAFFEVEKDILRSKKLSH